MVKKLATTGVAMCLLLLSAAPVSADSFVPRGKAALLLDGNSGQVLYQYNGTERNFPASTTKLLTALVAVEHGKLDQMITISSVAVDQPYDSSSCYLQEGEQQPLRHLLYGLMLASGNDCAIAIAEGVSGGRPEQFMTWMNETAARLGAKSSHFTNPHGLHEPDHYTTALDLALIAKGALSNPTVAEFAGSREFFWPGKSERNGIYYNHNQMLFYYSGARGGKTGYTEEAGLTLVSSAERDGLFLVGIVMGEKWKSEQYEDMEGLLDLGFAQFARQKAVAAGAVFGQVSVDKGKADSVQAVAAREFSIAAPKSGSSKVTTHPKLDSAVEAPVEQGQQVGVLEVREEKRVLATIPLVAGAAVEAKPVVGEMLTAGALSTGKWLLYVVGGLFVFRTIVKGIRRLMRRSRKGLGSSGWGGKGGGSRGSIDIYRTRNR